VKNYASHFSTQQLFIGLVEDKKVKKKIIEGEKKHTYPSKRSTTFCQVVKSPE
jgi:hypothetical protein